MAILHTAQGVVDLKRVMEDLPLLVASDDRVRVGLGTTAGKHTKTDPMSAADALTYITTTIDILAQFDIGLASLLIWRQD